MWKWPTRLREKDWMCVKALIRLETFSKPLVWEVMPLAAGRWKHLRDQRVDSASFFSSFSEGSGAYHSTSTIAPQANNLSVKGSPFPLGYVQRQQCRNCLVVGSALAQRAGQIDDELWYLIVDGDGDRDAPWVRWLFKGIPESELVSDERSGAMWRRRENGKESFTRCVCAIPWRWSGQVEIRGDRRSKSRFCRRCDQERECHCVVDLLSLIGTPPHSGLSGHEVDGLLQQHFSLCVSHFPWLNWPYWLFECDSIWWVWTNIPRSIFFTSSSTVAGQMWQKLFW